MLNIAENCLFIKKHRLWLVFEHLEDPPKSPEASLFTQTKNRCPKPKTDSFNKVSLLTFAELFLDKMIAIWSANVHIGWNIRVIIATQQRCVTDRCARDEIAVKMKVRAQKKGIYSFSTNFYTFFSLLRMYIHKIILDFCFVNFNAHSLV